jgi:hypothetical protein
MQKKLLKSIEEANFCANPGYELVLFDRLPPEQQKLLSDLQKDTDFYGILRPQEPGGLGIKSVDRDTALLFLTLQQPGRLPAYVKAQLGELCNQSVAELVLDSVLQIEWNGAFVSGSEAYGRIYEEKASSTAQGTIARLSLEALKYAQALEINDSSRLSTRLYLYNRVPLSPYWKRMFPTTDAVAEYLGIQAGRPTDKRLDQHWSRISPSPPNDGWLMWEPRHTTPALQKPGYTHKLYVSPACEFVRDAFQASVEVLSNMRAPHFKVGKDIYGLLRPDKFVVYFWSFEDLQEASEQLRHKLAGMPAHGVPFTAEIAGNGLLSWGIDPPAEEQMLGWLGRESWRLWITNRLALALLAAKAAKSREVEPWQFAMERLRLENVNTETWTPAKKIWQPIAKG